MQEWQRQKGSKGKVFAVRPRPSASAVTSRGLHPRQFAARGRAGQVAPWAARCRSCSSRGQRTSAGVAPRAIRGAWPRGTSRALGSSLSLVLIERPAHVRGGCTPGNSRRVAARDKSRLWQLASLVLIKRPAHVRGGVPPLSLCALGSSLCSCSSRGQRTSAGVAPRAIRGAWPRGTIRACGSSLCSCSSRGQRTSAGGRCVVPPLLGCVTEKALFA